MNNGVISVERSMNPRPHSGRGQARKSLGEIVHQKRYG
jgi:hypothetical protein